MALAAVAQLIDESKFMTDEEIKFATMLCEALQSKPRITYKHGSSDCWVLEGTSLQVPYGDKEELQFIAASYTLVPRMLNEIEQLKSELDSANVMLVDAMKLLNDVNPDYSSQEWSRLSDNVNTLKLRMKL